MVHWTLSGCFLPPSCHMSLCMLSNKTLIVLIGNVRRAASFTLLLRSRRCLKPVTQLVLLSNPSPLLEPKDHKRIWEIYQRMWPDNKAPHQHIFVPLLLRCLYLTIPPLAFCVSRPTAHTSPATWPLNLRCFPLTHSTNKHLHSPWRTVNIKEIIHKISILCSKEFTYFVTLTFPSISNGINSWERSSSYWYYQQVWVLRT